MTAPYLQVVPRPAATDIAGLPPLMNPRRFHTTFLTDVISLSSLYEAIRRADVPSVRIGRRYVIPVAPALAALGLDVSDAA